MLFINNEMLYILLFDKELVIIELKVLFKNIIISELYSYIFVFKCIKL